MSRSGWLLQWPCIALAAGGLIVTLMAQVMTLKRPFNYFHAWGAAGAAVEARAFREHGLAKFGGIPVHNNPPFGAHPEVDVHWPPLVYYSLAGWTAVFGESEETVHAFTLALRILAIAAMFWFLKVEFGDAAYLGALAWMALPVTLRFAHVVLNESMGMPFAILALVAFSRASNSLQEVERTPAGGPPHGKWTTWGSIAITIAVFSAWQFVLLPLGLVAATWWNRQGAERRIALQYLTVACATALGILIWYGIAAPELSRDTLHALAYRLGLSPVYTTVSLQNTSRAFPKYSLTEMLRAEAHNLITMLRWGLVVLFAVAIRGALLSKERKGDLDATIALALLCPGAIWYSLFLNHTAIHEFQALLFAPVIAFGTAWLLCKIRSPLALCVPLFFFCLILRDANYSLRVYLPVGRLVPRIEARADVFEPDNAIRLGWAIKERCEPGSVVLTPEFSNVPIYYSRRHIVSGVLGDDDVRRITPVLERKFPGAPLYIAGYAWERSGFSEAKDDSSRTGERFFVVRFHRSNE